MMKIMGVLIGLSLVVHSIGGSACGIRWSGQSSLPAWGASSSSGLSNCIKYTLLGLFDCCPFIYVNSDNFEGGQCRESMNHGIMPVLIINMPSKW